MPLRRAIFFGLSLATIVGAEEACGSLGEKTCADSDLSSMLQHASLHHSHTDRRLSLHICTHDGHDFPCADNHKCCGGQCIPVNAKCCTNDDGIDFQCDEFSTCCGNACAAPGSECCTNREGYQYPVAEGTKCEDELCMTCTNTYGVNFACGINSTCCGDICVGEGGACCWNDLDNSFACGAGSSCCGNVCAGAGSVCCEHNGVKYPVAGSTICPSNLLQSSSKIGIVQRRSRQASKKGAAHGIDDLISKGLLKTCSHGGFTTHCPGDQACCGHSCMPADSVCCTNNHDFNFQCGHDSTCCGNACAAPGSKCCTNSQGYEYPVAEGTECASDLSITCNTGTHGQVFYCGVNSTCCGDVCVGAGGQCCENRYGHAFACGAGSACCGDACAGEGSTCCTHDGVMFPVTEDTQCPGDRLLPSPSVRTISKWH